MFQQPEYPVKLVNQQDYKVWKLIQRGHGLYCVLHYEHVQENYE